MSSVMSGWIDSALPDDMRNLTRSTVKCKWAHVALFPGKDTVRRDWVESIPKQKDIITISHGGLGVFNNLRRKGRIIVCDVDKGVVATTFHMREGDKKNKKGSDYPDLKVLIFHGDIRDAVREYLKRYGVRSLGAIDMDLTGTANQVTPAVLEVVKSVCKYKPSSGIKIIVTFCRRGKKGSRTKSCFRQLSNHLRNYAKLIEAKQYRSDFISMTAERIPRSNMAVAIFKTRGKKA